MNLLRPINIVAGERPLSIYESVGGQKDGDQNLVRYLLLLMLIEPFSIVIFSSNFAFALVLHYYAL